jgi:hypothetical protein
MRFALLLICLLFSCGRVPAQFLEITAEIQLTISRADDLEAEKRATPRAISVVCVVGTNTWRIEDDWSMNATNDWYFDGRNVYEAIRITKPIPSEAQDALKRSGLPANPPLEETRSNLTVYIWTAVDGQPLGNEGVNLAWLAFCSGQFLSREGRRIGLPCDELRHTPDRLAYRDQVEILPNSGGLPQSIDLFPSKAFYLESIEGFYKGWGTHYLPSMRRAVTNLDEGNLTFHYAVTATTNFLSRTLPLRFEFFQKGRRFIQNGNWNRRGVGTVKTLREVTPPRNVFDPTRHQSIVDWRFVDDETGLQGNIYTWTNDSVPSVTDPKLQEHFQKAVAEARRHRNSTH